MQMTSCFTMLQSWSLIWLLNIWRPALNKLPSPALVPQHDVHDIQDQYGQGKGGGCRKQRREEEVEQKRILETETAGTVTNLQESSASFFYYCNLCNAQSSFPKTEPESKNSIWYYTVVESDCLIQVSTL